MKNIYVLLTIVGLLAFSQWGTRTIHPVFLSEVFSSSLIAAHYTAISLTGLFGGFVGRLLVKIDARKSLPISIALLAAGVLTRSIGVVYWQFFSGISIGLAATFLSISLKQFILKSHEAERNSFLLGNEIYTSLGQSFGIVSVGWVASYLIQIYGTQSGYELTFYGVFAILVVLFFWVLACLPVQANDQPGNKHANQPSTAERAGVPFVEKVFYLSVFLGGICQGTISPLIPLLMHDVGFSLGEIGIVLSMSLACGAMFTIFISKKVRTLPMEYLFILSSLIFSLIALLCFLKISYFVSFFAIAFFGLIRVLTRFSFSRLEVEFSKKTLPEMFFGNIITFASIGEVIGSGVGAYAYHLGLNRPMAYAFVLVNFVASLLLITACRAPEAVSIKKSLV